MPTTTDSATTDAGALSKEVPELTEKHLAHLQGSAISLEVIRERGYKTVLGRAELSQHGFSQAQVKRTPGILIPLHGVDGALVGHQYRPDHPRTDQARGRTIKYENPAGASVHLDCPPRCRPALGNPAVPLYITEGVKKVDALATAGACAIGLTGVWGFKGKNEYGASTFLADWDHVALRERLAYLVFDSDAATNPHVGRALERLSAHLGRKGAKVRILRLPPGKDGAKVGADDYLAQGGTLEALVSLEDVGAPRQSLREKSHETYSVEDGRICWNHPLERGGSELVPLCNFTAHVAEEVTRDNGMEVAKFFKVTGKTALGQDMPQVEVPAASFASLGWVVSEWGMRAVIAAGMNAKDRLREALQLMSQDAQPRHIYTHTGWRRIEGADVYLSAGGAIGADGLDVELEPQLGRYFLPPPIEDPAGVLEAVRASVEFLSIGKLEVTLPLWAAMYLAPLAEAIPPAFTMWLFGPSGCFKSVVTALALNHFGDFDHNTLPASWRDTANQLEKLLFLAKDMPLVIDDWAPGQDAMKARELEVKAEHIVRAQGNRQGKGRMRSDTSSRPNYAPRGLLLTSGEQLPSGHSHTARIFAVRLEPGDIDQGLLTEAQHKRHLYRRAMAHFIKHLQRGWLDKKMALRQEAEELRAKILSQAGGGDIHARLPDVLALLLIGLNQGLNFAVDQGALPEKDARALMRDGQQLFVDMARAQGSRVQEERPANRFIEALRTSLTMGVAVLRNKADVEPRDPGPGKTAVGWRDYANGHIYLDPGSAYQVVVQYYERVRDPFTIKPAAAYQDLRRMGFIDCKEGDERATIAMWIQGATRRVLALKKDLIDVPFQAGLVEENN